MKNFFYVLGFAVALSLSLPVLVTIADAWTWIVLGSPVITDWTPWKVAGVIGYSVWLGGFGAAIAKGAK